MKRYFGAIMFVMGMVVLIHFEWHSDPLYVIPIGIFLIVRGTSRWNEA